MAVTTLESIEDKETERKDKSKIRSMIGRIYLQLGDVNAASLCFSQASSIRDGGGGREAKIDQAFLCIAGNKFEEALSFLKEALKDDADDKAVIINNMSVCLLYMGKLEEALSLLESNLTANPQEFLRETQVLNLATLYELESSYANQKKQSLMDFMSRYSGDGASTACLKF